MKEEKINGEIVSGKKTKFLKHVHYFRAFAIINIVFSHIWEVPLKYQFHDDVKVINILREVLFHCSTIYFLFISGFLFYYLSPTFETIKYYKNKISYVILPYAFITFLFVFYEVIQHEAGIKNFIKNLISHLIYGKAQIQYWYIPFISLVFLISPLLLKIPIHIFKRIVIVACLLPLFGLRTGIEVTVYQYLFFFPTYLLGMYAAMDHSNFTVILKKNKFALFVLAIATSGLLMFLYHRNITVNFGPINITESIFYIQKIAICFLIFIFLSKIKDKEIVLLDYFATYSFAIYFTHTLVGNNSVRSVYFRHINTYMPDLLFPLSFLFAVIISLATLLLCMFLKRLLGSRSRYLIGV